MKSLQFFIHILGFSGEQLILLNSNKHLQKYSCPRVQCSVVQTDPSFSLPALARLINFVINSFSLNDWRREPAPKASVFKGHTICRFGQTLSRNHFVFCQGLMHCINTYLHKDLCINGRNTPQISFLKLQGSNTTPRLDRCVFFLTILFYNLKKFLSRPF